MFPMGVGRGAFRVGLAAAAGVVTLVALLGAARPVETVPLRTAPPPAAPRDLPEIREGECLIVGIPRDGVALDRHLGRYDGLAYELAKKLGRSLDVEICVEPLRNPSRGLRELNHGEIDLIAVADPGPRPVLVDVHWTAPVELDHPRLVGRGAADIRRVEDLEGRQIAVRRHSALERVAFRWRERLDGRLRIERVPPTVSPYELVLSAARDERSLVLLGGRRAVLEAALFGAVSVSPPLSGALPIRWAVRPTSPQLLSEVNDFLNQVASDGTLARLEQRYLENPLRLKGRRRPVFRTDGPRISPFDALFQEAADRHGFDWRLLAAIAFAESGYDPWEKSPVGAIGLLQLMPAVADEYGVEDPWDPRQNVEAGAALLRWLYTMFDDVESEDRMAFALAAYNMGRGHVEDARALAAMRGLDPYRWEGNVATVLPDLEDPAVASKLPHGQAQGRTTLRYVRHVIDLYERITGNGGEDEGKASSMASASP
jgi:membrane-bound lytic murein transglycosylase F